MNESRGKYNAQRLWIKWILKTSILGYLAREKE
jgi:hypothetical protein